MHWEAIIHVYYPFQTKRLDAFKELKQSIQMLWVELERTPSASLEFELVQEDSETTFRLSSQNMEGLKALHYEVMFSFLL